MGIALLGFADLSHLFTPLQSLASRWMPARRARRGDGAGLRYVAVRPACTARHAAARADRPAPALRVVRMVDAAPSGPGGIGGERMVISGRMSDVCAELDRLAALEASRRLQH